MLISAFAYPAGAGDRLRDTTRREHLLAVRAAKRPFWRRERRRDVAPVVVEASVDAAPDESRKEPKVPWYKREVGPKKRKDENKQTATPPEPKGTGDEPKGPWYKREIGRKKNVRPAPGEPVDGGETEEVVPAVVEHVLAAPDDEPVSDAEAAEPTTAPSAAVDAWSAFFGDAVVTGDTPASEPEPLAQSHDETDTATEDAPAEAKVPWYKREVGRKKKAEPVVAEVVRDERPAEEPKVPWYKREVGRKKKAEPVVAEVVRDERPAEEPKVPWYKREVGRKKRAEPAVVAEVVRDERPADEPTPVERILAATQRDAQAAAGPTVPEPVVETPVGNAWSALAGDEPAATMPSEEPVAPESTARSIAGETTEELTPAFDAPEVSVETSAPKVPWYKREIGRKKTDGEPKAKKEKKDKRARKKDGRAEAPRPAGPKVPWYKREIGGKKPAAPQTMTDRRHSGRGGGRKQRIVGLKVGGSQLAAARIVNNGSAELVQLARMNLPKGVVVGGELRDPEALTIALKKFFRDNKLPRQGVRLGIGSNRIGVRVFDIAGVEDRTLLDNAVRFKAQEFLPIPLEQAVLDYHVVSESVDEDGRVVYRVLVAFAYRELVDRYLDVCKRAGIRLSGIDLEAFALLRALGAPASVDAPPRDAAVIAVAIGHDRSTLAVSDGRICEFTRILEWGGFQLDVAVSRVLDVTPSEAEAVKLQVDFTSPSRAIADLSPDRSMEVRDAVRRQIELLARELVSSLQFYQSQPGSLGVGEIVITGGTAQLPGLAEELQRLIGVKVRVGDPYARVKVGRRVKAETQLPSLAVAIGLGIED